MKVEFNFCVRHWRKFAFPLHFETWDADGDVKEFRLYFLVWEFNFEYW